MKTFKLGNSVNVFHVLMLASEAVRQQILFGNKLFL